MKKFMTINVFWLFVLIILTGYTAYQVFQESAQKDVKWIYIDPEKIKTKESLELLMMIDAKTKITNGAYFGVSPSFFASLSKEEQELFSVDMTLDETIASARAAECKDE